MAGAGFPCRFDWLLSSESQLVNFIPYFIVSCLVQQMLDNNLKRYPRICVLEFDSLLEIAFIPVIMLYASALPEQLSTCLERFKTKQVPNKERMRAWRRQSWACRALGARNRWEVGLEIPSEHEHSLRHRQVPFSTGWEFQSYPVVVSACHTFSSLNMSDSEPKCLFHLHRNIPGSFLYCCDFASEAVELVKVCLI